MGRVISGVGHFGMGQFRVSFGYGSVYVGCSGPNRFGSFRVSVRVWIRVNRFGFRFQVSFARSIQTPAQVHPLSCLFWSSPSSLARLGPMCPLTSSRPTCLPCLSLEIKMQPPLFFLLPHRNAQESRDSSASMIVSSFFFDCPETLKVIKSSSP